MPMVHPSITAAAGAATDGGRRPRVVAAPAAAAPELSARPRRRTFTAQDKLRILADADRAAETGGIGAILRWEGITRLPSLLLRAIALFDGLLSAVFDGLGRRLRRDEPGQGSAVRPGVLTGGRDVAHRGYQPRETTMSPLRARMIDAMTLAGLAKSTQAICQGGSRLATFIGVRRIS